MLHEPSLDATRRRAEEVAAGMAAAGAEVFVAAVVMDAAWAPPAPLDAAQFARLVEHLAAIEALVQDHGLTFALHPHAGTLVETAADVDRLLAASDVGWCLDTGHLLIGGYDPVAFTRDHGDRVVHVHLKDVDAGVAARYRAGELTLMGADPGRAVPAARGGGRRHRGGAGAARRPWVRALARARAGRRAHRPGAAGGHGPGARCGGEHRVPQRHRSTGREGCLT